MKIDCMENRKYSTIVLNSAKHKVWKNHKPLLSHLIFELTERCNNNCIHCFINQPRSDQNLKNRELKTEKIKELLNEAASLGTITVRFTGGEPLLREDFLEIYLHARRLGLKVEIFTNGRLITDELADVFKSIPPLKKIEISLYGISDKSYESISRIKGSFDEYQMGVLRLIKRNIPFTVKTVFLEPIIEEKKQINRWIRNTLGANFQILYTMKFALRSRRDSEEKDKAIKKLRPDISDFVKRWDENKSDYFKNMSKFCQIFMKPAGDRIFACGAGQSGCVDAYGILQPCLMCRHPSVSYNLNVGTLEDAFKKFFPSLKHMKTKKSEYLNRCARCMLMGLCRQCPGYAWTENGTLDTPVEYLCQIAHANARYLGILKENELGWQVNFSDERRRALLQRAQENN